MGHLRWGKLPSRQWPSARGMEICGIPPLNHPNDENLSLHPSEQQSLAGNRVSYGTPMRQKKRKDGEESDIREHQKGGCAGVSELRWGVPCRSRLALETFRWFEGAAWGLWVRVHKRGFKGKKNVNLHCFLCNF